MLLAAPLAFVVVMVAIALPTRARRIREGMEVGTFRDLLVEIERVCGVRLQTA